MNKVIHISKEIMLYILKVIGIILGVSAVGIIIFLFSIFLNFHIFRLLRPLELRKIPDYVAKTGNEQVYIPDKVGDERYDNGGKNGILYLGWIFNLEDGEMAEALKYVEEYPDAWHSVDDSTLSRIDGEYDGEHEIDINRISGHDAYYYTHDWIPAFFIVDLTENTYYCIYIAVRT